MPGHKWTEAEKRWLIRYIPGHQESEIIEAFRMRFGWTMRRAQLKNMKTVLRTPSGTTGGRFYKGQQSWNKGKKLGIKGRMAETMFKPGRRPHNYLPVGSEIIDGEGYHKVKVADPKTWKFKHRLIWEEHNGEIPKGGIVVFVDGDRDNLDIGNLMMLTRKEQVRANQDDVWSLPKPLRRTALLAVKLKVAAGIKKGRNNGKE